MLSLPPLGGTSPLNSLQPLTDAAEPIDTLEPTEQTPDEPLEKREDESQPEDRDGPPVVAEVKKEVPDDIPLEIIVDKRDKPLVDVQKNNAINEEKNKEKDDKRIIPNGNVPHSKEEEEEVRHGIV